MLFEYHIDGCTITNREKNLVEEKLEKLTKFDNRLANESVKTHLKIVRGLRHKKPNYGIKAQITIPGGFLRAEASGKTIADTMDDIEGALRSQIEKLSK